jgi:hypothetical protein
LVGGGAVVEVHNPHHRHPLMLRNSSQLREAVMVLRRSRLGKRKKKAGHWRQNCSTLGDM